MKFQLKKQVSFNKNLNGHTNYNYYFMPPTCETQLFIVLLTAGFNRNKGFEQKTMLSYSHRRKHLPALAYSKQRYLQMLKNKY